MKRDAFEAKGIRVETSRDFDGRWFTVWKPNASIYCRTRTAVLRFVAWPAKTPTGDSLRAWLDSLADMDQERVSKSAEPLTGMDAERTSNLTENRSSLGDGWDPLAHEEDPALSTKMVL